MVDIKESVFSDELFAEYRQGRDDVDVVLDLTEFKYTLTSQLALNREAGDRDIAWVRSVTSIVIRVKNRIAEVRRDVRAAGRGEEMSDALFELREEAKGDEG
jgi:hypothetical protein